MKPLHPIDTSNTSFSHIGFETVEATGEGLRPDLQDQSSATADPTYKTQGGEALYDLYKKAQQASWSEFLAWNGILVDVPKNVILPAGMTIYLQDPSTLPMSDNDSPDISLYLDPDVEMPRDGGLTVYTETLERSLVHQHLETLRSTGKRYGFDLNHFQRDNTALSHDGVFFQQAFNGLVDVLGEDGALEVLAHAESTYRIAVMQSQGAYLPSAFEKSLQAQQQSKVLFKQEYGETWGPIMLAFASHAVPGGGGGWDLVMLGGFGAAAPRALPGGARPQMQFIEMRRTLNDGQTLIRRKDLQTNQVKYALEPANTIAGGTIPVAPERVRQEIRETRIPEPVNIQSTQQRTDTRYRQTYPVPAPHQREAMRQLEGVTTRLQNTQSQWELQLLSRIQLHRHRSTPELLGELETLSASSPIGMNNARANIEVITTILTSRGIDAHTHIYGINSSAARSIPMTSQSPQWLETANVRYELPETTRLPGARDYHRDYDFYTRREDRAYNQPTRSQYPNQIVVSEHMRSVAQSEVSRILNIPQAQRTPTQQLVAMYHRMPGEQLGARLAASVTPNSSGQFTPKQVQQTQAASLIWMSRGRNPHGYIENLQFGHQRNLSTANIPMTVPRLFGQ